MWATVKFRSTNIAFKNRAHTVWNWTEKEKGMHKRIFFCRHSCCCCCCRIQSHRKQATERDTNRTKNIYESKACLCIQCKRPKRERCKERNERQKLSYFAMLLFGMCVCFILMVCQKENERQRVWEGREWSGGGRVNGWERVNEQKSAQTDE